MQPSQNDCTMLPSAVSTTSASSKWSFRGSIAAAYTLAVYASQWRLPHTHHARLASGRWLVPLPGGVDVRLEEGLAGDSRLERTVQLDLDKTTVGGILDAALEMVGLTRRVQDGYVLIVLPVNGADPRGTR